MVSLIAGHTRGDLLPNSGFLIVVMLLQKYRNIPQRHHEQTGHAKVPDAVCIAGFDKGASIDRRVRRWQLMQYRDGFGIGQVRW